MSRSSKWSQSQVVIADLDAWVKELYKSHRVRIQLSVCLVLPDDHINHAVWLEAYRTTPDGHRDNFAADWSVINPYQSGGIERAALQMVSKLLLQLDNEQAEAERQASLWD